MKQQRARAIEGPQPAAEQRRWHLAAADRFVIVGAEFETGAKTTTLHCYLSEDPGASPWDLLNLSQVTTTDRSILSIAAVHRRATGIRMALCVPKGIYVVVLDTKPPYHVKTSRKLMEDTFKSPAMQCCVDESGRLVVAVWQKGIFVLDEDWYEVIQQINDPGLHQPQGLSVKDVQIYVLLPNMIRVFDYV